MSDANTLVSDLNGFSVIIVILLILWYCVLIDLPSFPKSLDIDDG